MSGKLDQSLDEIMKDNKPAGGRRGRTGRLPARKATVQSKPAPAVTMAPSGGVFKRSKLDKPTRATIAAVVPTTGDSKISVSNLPEDVDEQMIKEYFSQIVAPVKRVIINYGPNGRSRGSATIIFAKATAAAEATKYDGQKVDGKPMRIEVLMGAKSIPAPPAPKSLKDRVSGPRNAAKEIERKKFKQDVPRASNMGLSNGVAKAGKGNKKKSGRAGKPKAKTAEELDAEMQDYFGGGDVAAANGIAGSAVAASNGDTGMADEVM